MTDRITTAIRADAATSDAEGRAQANEMVTAAVIGALAETVTRLNESEDRALRLEVQRDELLAQIERIDDMLPPSLSRTMSLADNVRAAIAEAVSRGSLAADLNAAREKLTTAEAFRDSLQAEVDKLRARPVLTEERLDEALDFSGVTVKAGESRGPQIRGLADAAMRYLVPSTLPAQDRAEELTGAIHGGSSDEIAEKVWAAMVERTRRALASLGAPAKTPSKPADVFAGVSIEELAGIYAASFGATTAQSPARIVAISAILDALRVKLVAPVDPEAFARAYMERVVPGLYDACKSPSLHFSSMRLALEAKGIPVTPEAGK